MSKRVLEAIVAHWERLGVPRRPGLGADTLDAFERRYRVRLPAAMRSFYEFVDGMPEGFADDEFISYWPLAEVAPVPVKLGDIRNYSGIEESLPEVGSYFLFADHSIWLHMYAVQLLPESAVSAPVVWIAGGNCWHLLAPSFAEFLAQYAQEPFSVLFPK
jgi:hypothetical protein